MQIKRALARIFFAGSLVAMLTTVFHVPAVQATESEEDEAPVCADGNRKLCATMPLSNGGTRYYYWV